MGKLIAFDVTYDLKWYHLFWQMSVSDQGIAWSDDTVWIDEDTFDLMYRNIKLGNFQKSIDDINNDISILKTIFNMCVFRNGTGHVNVRMYLLCNCYAMTTLSIRARFLYSK